jgi:hypothetical protein
MTTQTAGPLEYSTQPSNSLAVLERLDEHRVRVSMPPPIGRSWVKVVFVAQILGCLSGPSLLVLSTRGLSLLAYVGIVVTMLAASTLVTMLRMAFRWTIVEVGPDGIRVDLRGPCFTRRRFYPREQIGGVRKAISILILDRAGRRLGKIDATDWREEIWLTRVLQDAAVAAFTPVGEVSLSKK